jgi:hypothetical protein
LYRPRGRARSIGVKLPRALYVLGTFALVLGGFGSSRALMEQVVPYLGSHESFVSEHRREIELRNQFSSPEVAPDVIQRAGDAYGERAWTRRGINLPLGLVNLVLSVMLFLGALRALARSQWGHGAWQFAARLSIVYSLVWATVGWVEARDAFDANAALATNLSLQLNIPAETLAGWELWRDRGFAVAWAAILAGFFATCALYLRRPQVRALFTEQ